jgi:hypothetical protein
MNSIPFRRPLAAVLVAVCSTFLSLPPVLAMDASFSGRVFEADGMTPRSGVTVNLIKGEGESIYTSSATSADGTFVIEAAPAGSYSLLVDSGQEAFLSPEPLELQSGVNKPLALTLNASRGETRQTGLGSARPMKPWLKWTTVGLISVTALYVGHRVLKSETGGSEF